MCDTGEVSNVKKGATPGDREACLGLSVLLYTKCGERNMCVHRSVKLHHSYSSLKPPLHFSDKLPSYSHSPLSLSPSIFFPPSPVLSLTVRLWKLIYNCLTFNTPVNGSLKMSDNCKLFLHPVWAVSRDKGGFLSLLSSNYPLCSLPLSLPPFLSPCDDDRHLEQSF